MGSTHSGIPKFGPAWSWQWLGTVCQLAGTFTIALKLPFSGYAFPVLLFGSVLWAAIAWRRNEHALLFLNCGYSLVNVVGILRWL